MSLDTFLTMGGYGAFVWPAYAVTLVVLIGNVFAARSSHRRALSDALRRAAREEGRT
jgi:heme exporter protein D